MRYSIIYKPKQRIFKKKKPTGDGRNLVYVNQI